MRRADRGVDERAHLLASVANMYYSMGMTQADIARQVGYSRSAISRLLDEAQARGIVEIRINFPLNRSVDLERQLKDRFKLRDAYVMIRGGVDDAKALRQLGRLGAACLEDVLSPDSRLGISWGTAVYEVVHALRPRRWPDSRVVQMIGTAGRGDPAIDGPELARALAEVLGTSYSTLNTPLIVDDVSTRQALLSESKIAESLSAANHVDVALVGIGSVEPEISSLVRAGYLRPDELASIKAQGAVGDVCATHYALDGRILDIDINRRMVGVNLEALHRPSCLAIGVAGGRLKSPAILGALRGGHVDVLVTDDDAAEKVLADDKSTAQATAVTL